MPNKTRFVYNFLRFHYFIVFYFETIQEGIILIDV
jgi:hypothetical protein